MTNIIRVNNVSFYAYHGVFKNERNVGGKFEADVELFTDFSRAVSKDDLNKTVNYERVWHTLHEIAVSKKYYLLESLANRIVAELFERFPKVEKLAVRVRKNNPPIGGVVESVEVEAILTREEFERLREERRANGVEDLS